MTVLGEQQRDSVMHVSILIACMLLLLLSHFSPVWLCETPQTAAHQAPASLGFSRQEHWSGLPFPSPMHENGKWKVKVKSLSCVWPSWTLWTAAFQSSVHGIFQVKSTGVGCHCLLQKICIHGYKSSEYSKLPFLSPLGLFVWSPIRLLGLPGYISLRPGSPGLCSSSSLNQRIGTSYGNWE